MREHAPTLTLHQTIRFVHTIRIQVPRSIESLESSDFFFFSHLFFSYFAKGVIRNFCFSSARRRRVTRRPHGLGRTHPHHPLAGQISVSGTVWIFSLHIFSL
ncbi:hypothetical protein ABW19_dt0203500 [Dactylella cylindrospora]|nr:hypothetical protein ABW19_dt0203500 [Dactylella cylindrospora]